MIIKIVVLLGSLFSTAVFAQNPCDPSIRSEMKDRYLFFYTAVKCIEIKQRRIFDDREEMTRFLSGRMLGEYKQLIRDVIQFYPVFEKQCEKGAVLTADQKPQCKSFNRKLRDSLIIKHDVFRIAVILGDVDLVKDWVSGGMPYYDLNLMMPFFDLRVRGKRGTIAEAIAINEFVPLAVLKYVVEQGLVNPQADESFPLHAAISSQQYGKMMYLIEKGWDINVQAIKPIERYLSKEDMFLAEDQRGTTPLIAAIINKSLAEFQALMRIESLDPNKKQLMHSYTPLMVAADGAMFDQNPSDPYFLALLNDERTNLNENNAPSGSFNALSVLSNYYLNPGVAVHMGVLISRLVSHPGFDANLNCTRENPCLQTFLPPYDGIAFSPEKFKAYEQLVRKLDPSTRGYHLLKTKDLTLMEYLDGLKANLTTRENRRQIAKIRRMAKGWLPKQ